MSQTVVDSQVVQCIECGKVYVGVQKQNGCVVPRGMAACSQCGNEDFGHVTLADLGLE
jgi:predicted  nucleic acid-binding Zn-ribbon protein